MVLSIFHILLQSLNGHGVTGLILREPHINLELVHHLGNSFTLGTDQTAVYTMVYCDVLTYLLLLQERNQKHYNKKLG